MISDETAQNRSRYNFSEPMDLRAFADHDRLLLELVETPAFQRLKLIRFLGAIDYLLVPAPNGVKGNIRHTRYQHSLGVARLALLYSVERALSFANGRVVCVAALLHDIGHAPLSHSLEPLFKEIFEIEHHRTTEDIVTGRVPLGREVYETLRRNHVDVDRVIAIIAGNETGYDGFFAGPINFDTIEGILRSQTYAKPNPNIPSPEAIMEAALRRSSERDRAAVDEFWTYKDQVYRYLINSRSGVLADFACQLFMRRHLNKITVNDYFLTETQMFRKLPGLQKLLTNPLFEAEVMRQLDESILYKIRRFFIDPNADFFQRNDVRRYRQIKEDKVLLPRRTDVVKRTELKQDLFDDDGDRSGEAAL
jgi:HD superfamily phosphohydrolase